MLRSLSIALLLTSCAGVPTRAPRSLPAAPPLPAESMPAIATPTGATPAVANDEANEPSGDAQAPTYLTRVLLDESVLRVGVRYDVAACSGEAASVVVEIQKYGEPLDELSLATDDVPSACSPDGAKIELADYNFDGNYDIAVPLDDSGPYHSPTYAILLYQPLNGHYQEAPLLSAITRETLGMFRVDEAGKRLVASGKSGCCEHWELDYSVSGDYPEEIGRRFEIVALDSSGCLVTTELSGRRGNTIHQRRCRKDEILTP